MDLGSDMFAEKGFMMKLDTSKHLLGVRNGVIDLRTGKLRQALPEDMVCRELEVEYDENMDTAFIDNLILTIQAEDEEMAKYMQKLLGYGLTGEVCEEIFVFFTNGGRNGKGVLLKPIEDLMNNTGFYVQANMGLIVKRSVSNIDAERAKLHGSRFLIFNELLPGDMINLDDFKALSGGDSLPAAAKYGAPFSIQPQYLPLCATNTMPELPLVDVATAQRVIAIEFPVTFVDLSPEESATKYVRQRDNTLKAQMQRHKAELLRWLVKGAVAWYREGGWKRNAPKKVADYTQQYLNDQDDIETCLRREFERGFGFKVSTAEALSRYNETADEPLKIKELIGKMASKGIKKKPSRVEGYSGTVQCFIGIRLKEQDEDSE